MTCPQCGHKNSPNERFCSRCGASLIGGAKFNKGCFIPMILILSVFVMSAILLLVIDLLDTHAPKIIDRSPTISRPTPVRTPTTVPTTLPATLPSASQ